MWELILGLGDQKHATVVSHRLRVPGGWIVRSVSVGYTGTGTSVHSTQTFVDDKNHEWKLEGQPKRVNAISASPKPRVDPHVSDPEGLVTSDFGPK